MTDSDLKDKVALVTGGNNPFGIGAATARALAYQGAKVFIHYFRQVSQAPDKEAREPQDPGLAFYLQQQEKTADEVLASIRESGGGAESWEGDLREPENVHRLFEQAEKAFGHIDILVNNAADYAADTFLAPSVLGQEAEEALVADIPLRRIGRSEDIANAVVFFASEQAAWITGQLLFVHGGHRMAFGL